MNKYIPIFIIIFFIITPFSSNIITDASSSISNIIYVDDDGEAEYKKIQEAINIANDGDIIFVNKGIYQENIFINKSITLTGENKNNTYIIGNHINDVINISNQGVIVSDFTIKNSGKSGGITSAAHRAGAKGEIALRTSRWHEPAKNHHPWLPD